MERIQRLKTFMDCFDGFYGPHGIYPNPFSKEQILIGVLFQGKNFQGDSIDREKVRDFVSTIFVKGKEL